MKVPRFLRRGRKVLDPATAYELWDYPDDAENPVMELDEEGMTSLMPDLEGLRCLDLACGTGRYIRHLMDRGGVGVVGLDFAAGMVERVRSRGFRAIRGSLTNLPIASGSFDMITCALAVGHVPDLDRVLAEMSRVLGQTGILVYSDFHPEATEAGFQRTFTGPSGGNHIIEHHLHTIEDHKRILEQEGFGAIEFVHLGGEQGPRLVVTIRAVKS